VTQDDLLYRFRPRVFAIAAELGTVRAAGRAMGIIPRHITAEAAAGPPRPGDPGARPLPQRAAAQDRAGEMRFLTPANLVDLAEAIPARYRALVFVGAYGGLRIGELAGLRQSGVDLLAGAVTVAEILTESKAS
jgi:integrase